MLTGSALTHWAQPFDTLRAKWHEILLAAVRRSTFDLLAMAEHDLWLLWQEQMKIVAEDFTRRVWRHTLYRDAFRGKRILDVGSGFGFDAITFARAGAKVTCLDIHEVNLELVRRLAREAGVSLETAYLKELASIDALGDYDVIWCSGSLINLPSELAANESAKLLEHLKPGGRWMELCYPRARWERDGGLPFEAWGEKTDGGAPWM